MCAGLGYPLAVNISGTGTGTQNVLTGNTGVDSFTGGPGNNDYYVHNSSDTISVPAVGGTNRVYADVSYTLPTNVQELVLTGSANLSGTGNSGDNTIYSNSGVDTLTGGGGNDTFIVHNSSDQVVAAAAGTSTIFADVNYTLPANVTTLVLLGSANLTGTANNLNDTLNSNTGVDTLIGGMGNDTFVVSNSSDVVVASTQSQKNTVFSSVSYTLPAHVQALVLTGSGNLTGTGNGAGNTFTANTGNDTLLGIGGNNTFIPGPGQNTVDGGPGLNGIQFTGNRSQYRISGLPTGGVVVADQRNGTPDGIDTITRVQTYKFEDMTLTPSSPVSTGTSRSAVHAQTFAASSLFSVTDPLVDVMASYGFWDTGSGGAHFVLNGVTQGTNQEIDFSAAQLGQLVYQSGSGPDTIWVRAYNGFQWGGWSNAFGVTALVDSPPVVTPANSNTPVGRGATLAASSLFSVSDAEHDPIVQYDFWDTGTGGAHFVVNGASQGNNREVYVSAAQLAQSVYQSGPGTDTIYVRANDGFLWGAWSAAFTVTAPIPRQPVLSVEGDGDATRGETIALSQLVTISDPDQAGFTSLELWDSNGNPGTGQLVVNGAAQTGGHEIDVAPADVANTVFDVGTLGGTDQLWAQLQLNNGQLKGWQPFTVSAPAATLPSLSVQDDPGVRRGANLPLSALVTIADPDNAGFAQLHLWDSNGTLGGGQFIVNGAPQTGGHEIDVAPGDVAGTVFDVGTLGGSDTLYAQLLQWNGQLTAWKSFTVTAPAGKLPTLSVHSQSGQTRGGSIGLSTLVTIADPDNVSFQKLELWDGSGGSPTLGQFVVDGAPQTAGHEIDVAPADVANTAFDVGTLGGTDQLWAQLLQANGQLSGWQPFTVSAPAAQIPTLAVHSQSNQTRGASIALSTLVSIADPDGVSFQKLELWDSIGNAAGGQFVISGTSQGGGHEIDVALGDVANTVFDVGTLGGTDQLWAQLLQDNGQLTGWMPFTVSAPAAQLPTLTVHPFSGASAGMSIPLSTLVSITDPDGVGYQKLELWDSNGTAQAGQFVINNSPQGGGHEIDVNPGDVATAKFDVGTSGAPDTLWARLLQDNGTLTAWQQFTVKDPITIAAGATVEISSAYAGAVTFAGDIGTLVLDNSASFAGTVGGMTGNDTIDLADIDPLKAQQPSFSGIASGGTLTVTDGTNTANIALLGNYLASTFTPSPDGHGGTNLVDPQMLGGVQPLITPAHA